MRNDQFGRKQLKLLHVDAGLRQGKSISRDLARHFVERLRRDVHTLSVDHLDLVAVAPPHITEAFATATYTPAAERTDAMRKALARSDALCKTLLAADALLFAMPMHNWSMPSAFKAYIDAIVRGGITYVVTPDGQFQGQLTNRKVLFLTTRGVDLRAGSPLAGLDALTPALKAAFGFIGVEDPVFVDAQPVQFASDEAIQEALSRARDELDAVADQWASAWAAAPGRSKAAA
jgi:FMN-dependent NADH-azoreductase